MSENLGEGGVPNKRRSASQDVWQRAAERDVAREAESAEKREPGARSRRAEHVRRLQAEQHVAAAESGPVQIDPFATVINVGAILIVLGLAGLIGGGALQSTGDIKPAAWGHALLFAGLAALLAGLGACLAIAVVRAARR